MKRIFIAGGSGMIGRHLIPALCARGHAVQVLVRPGSNKDFPENCKVVIGNVLERQSFESQISPADTWVHLVGISHPSPLKANQFQLVDLASVQEAVAAAKTAGVNHFVYLSVAQPAPIMKSYLEARQEGEALIRQAGFNATFVRPWYVLGPGRRWPMILLPLYFLAGFVPRLRPGVQRLGFVTIDEMVLALLEAIEVPSEGVRILDVPTIHAVAQARGKIETP